MPEFKADDQVVSEIETVGPQCRGGSSARSSSSSWPKMQNGRPYRQIWKPMIGPAS